ncbi:MAG: mechanosensitive ion channel family protein [Bacteroidales bacterium]|jgi:small-conductance mechanosensitive channel
MNSIEELVEWLENAINYRLFAIGSSEFTTKTFLWLIISFLLLFFFAGKIKKILVKKIFPRYNIDMGIAESVGKIIQYILIVVGFIVIFQTTGIDLSALGVLVGALGVGIGFGLQGITNNFISGLIILFERPVKVGDRVEIEGLEGNIIKISGRATTILTNDNIAVIVPNSDLISKRVVNWSHNNRRVRITEPVGVSYKEDPQVVQKILVDVAKKNKGVLESPEPYVRFDEYADSSLNFSLLVWSKDFSDKPRILKSELYYVIFAEFKKKGIEIPFPQRDIHIIQSEAKEQ